MRQGPKRSRRETAAVRAARSQSLHVSRIATAPTPEARVNAAHDRIRALLKRADPDRGRLIADLYAAAVNKIADAEDERIARGAR